MLGLPSCHGQVHEHLRRQQGEGAVCLYVKYGIKKQGKEAELLVDPAAERAEAKEGTRF